jgi:hypothetical protein
MSASSFTASQKRTTLALIICSLCALHYKGPYRLTYLLHAVRVPTVLIGLPIAACARF